MHKFWHHLSRLIIFNAHFSPVYFLPYPCKPITLSAIIPQIHSEQTGFRFSTLKRFHTGVSLLQDEISINNITLVTGSCPNECDKQKKLINVKPNTHCVIISNISYHSHWAVHHLITNSHRLFTLNWKDKNLPLSHFTNNLMHQQAGIFWNIKPVSSNTNRPPMHRDSVITACNISQSLELKSQSAHMHWGRQGLREMSREREKK